MTLKLYNTATRNKDPFTPGDRKRVGMYVCGPTVYDYAHIGNARPVIVFDVLFRLLRHRYGPDNVVYVRNITDVDDKIIAAAKESGEAIDAVTERTAKAFHEDVKALGCLEPTHEPRATQYIPQMIAMIEALIAAGNAYLAEGHVLFSVATKPDYGKLSRKNRDELIDGARVEVAPYKKDPADFVLWKPSAPPLPGWDSPWGRGRPGWHIECSAMSKALLGETFDIHGGGADLIFPHHENEIAQSECAHGGAPFARFWLHNGYLTVAGEKMSKSLGNFITVRDLLHRAPGKGEAIRYNMLGTHYRKPADWTEAGFQGAVRIMDSYYAALHKVQRIEEEPGVSAPDNIVGALEDDLNTPLALRYMDGLVTALNKARPREDQARLKAELLAGGDLLGLAQQHPEAWRKREYALGAEPGEYAISGYAANLPVRSAGAPSKEMIDAKIADRAAARQAKNFAEADRIRQELAKQGIILEDKPGKPTEWRRA